MSKKISGRAAATTKEQGKQGDRPKPFALVRKERARAELAESQRDELLATCKVLLDSVDWSSGNCNIGDMVGAVLDRVVIDKARATIAKAEPVHYSNNESTLTPLNQ